jgi:hypothetical protein
MVFDKGIFIIKEMTSTMALGKAEGREANGHKNQWR